VVFQQEVAAAVQTWIDSTAYNHCFLVIPIAVYLLWDRKEELAALRAEPMPVAVLLAIPVGVFWLIAERLGIMEGRQLAVITFVQVLLLAVLGRRLYWASFGPLLYLYFLVPFGEFLTPRLQDLTTWFVRHGLAIIGIPAYIDGYIIEIPEGTFFVAEACAGLRFLIASIAFGCLYALLMYRGTLRRVVFIAASIIIPIIANGFRALGIVVLGHVLGSAQAAATDHVLYGWIFFSIVILLLIAVGLPFRQDLQPRSVPLPSEPLRTAAEDSRSSRRAYPRGVLAAVLVAVLAAIGPVLTAGLSMAATREAPVPASIAVASGCGTAPIPGGVPTGTGGQRVVCDGLAFDMRWRALSPRSTAAALMSARRQMIRPVLVENLSESWLPPVDGHPSAWRIMQADDPPYALAVAVWVDAASVRPGLATRARMAIESMTGGRYAPMVMTVTPAVSWDTLTRSELQRTVDQLRAFLRSQPGLDHEVGQASLLR
jgi:exosortase A